VVRIKTDVRSQRIACKNSSCNNIIEKTILPSTSMFLFVWNSVARLCRILFKCNKGALYTVPMWAAFKLEYLVDSISCHHS
jgi:hypothetical protein